MVERTAEHPPREQVEAYGQGRLGPEAAAPLEAHLTDCESCCALLEQTPADHFVSQLRGAAPFNQSTCPHYPGASAAAAPPIPAELIGHPRYRVLGLVGQGGMGAVYRAEHRRMERAVALKVIHPGVIRNPAAVERFHQEARAAARLQHPNIVTAYEADSAGGLHFLVLEYIDGVTLAELVRRHGPLPVDVACEYIYQAALGLQHAHEKGMVHRDIKPHNLMLQAGPHGEVIKLLDLGLARLSIGGDVLAPSGSAGKLDTAPLTAAGAVMGTADYIAPEQAADPSGADIRADIYSLGCTLFHLLTGRPPFAGDTVTQKLAQHAASPLPLSELGRAAGVAAVLARMTAKDPAGRYATPAEVARALAPFRPAAARPVRRKLAAAVVALAAVALLAGAVAWRLRRGTPEAEPPPGPTLVEAPAVRPTEEQALELVRKLGGWARRDDFESGVAGVRVNLRNTSATDADLEVVAAIKHLTQLDLAQTPITGAGLKHLTGQKHLRALVLAFTRVGDAALEYVEDLKDLQTLELQSTPVGDDGVKHLAGLSKLRTLYLSGTHVSDAGMSAVGRLKSLTFLSLDQTGVGDAGLLRLEGLAELKYLGLFYTRWASDEGMKSVARLRNLQSIDLCGTRLTDRGVAELAGLTGLTSLRLGGASVTDAGVRALAGLPDLQHIDLAGTGVTDDGLKEVVKHRTLTNVDLKACRNVTDAGIKEVAGLPELTTLALDGTGVTDAGLAELVGCPKLAHLRLFGASRITDAGVAKLRDARPGLAVRR